MLWYVINPLEIDIITLFGYIGLQSTEVRVINLLMQWVFTDSQNRAPAC